MHNLPSLFAITVEAQPTGASRSGGKYVCRRTGTVRLTDRLFGTRWATGLGGGGGATGRLSGSLCKREKKETTFKRSTCTVIHNIYRFIRRVNNMSCQIHQKSNQL